MQSWVKLVEVADLDPDKLYFIAVRPRTQNNPLLFQSQADRKANWTTKPGIAAKYSGRALIEGANFRERKDLVAVEVPKDADTRWKARRLTRRNPFR